MLEKNQLVQIEIRGLSNDGNGVGSADGFTVFVPFTAVGDVVSAKIVSVKKSFAYGIIDRIVSPSHDRVEPPCQSFKKCGGCAFMHLSYSAELEAKRGFVRDALARIGGLAVDVEPTATGDAQLRYRNKVQFPVEQGQNGAVCGLYAARSHRVIEVSDCLLQDERLNAIAADVCGAARALGINGYNEVTGQGTLRHIYLRASNGCKQVMLCLVVNARRFPLAKQLAQKICEKHPEITTVCVNYNPKSTNVILGDKTETVIGDGYITDSLCAVDVKLDPHSFYQVNRSAAQTLYGFVRDYCSLDGGETVLDLYCGAGSIGLSLADRCKSLVGVDIVPQAIDDAIFNAKNNGFTNCTFLCGDAQEQTAKLIERGERFDVIITDPARKGCSVRTIELICALNPKTVVMVSCNPATLARDLASLVSGGYAVRRVQPVDMFPKTTHVETVVLITRAKE